MSKNAKAKTKNVKDIVIAKNSVPSTKNCLPKKISPLGARMLAIGVIKSAIFNEDKKIDITFFKSDAFDFWANLAYGCKPNYVDGIHIPSLIRKNSVSNKKPSNRVRRTSKE